MDNARIRAIYVNGPEQYRYVERTHTSGFQFYQYNPSGQVWEFIDNLTEHNARRSIKSFVADGRYKVSTHNFNTPPHPTESVGFLQWLRG